MNDQQLKDFGTHAETLVEIPDLAALDRQGHELRVRRRAGVAGALAMVLAVAGVLAQTHRQPAQDQPVKPPHLDTDVRPYENVRGDIEEGTYRLRPSLLHHQIAAEFTVPSGYDAWVGPQTGGKGWYANALILEIDQVNTHACMPDVALLETPAQVSDALSRAASTRLLRGPDVVQRFGHTAIRLRLRVTKAFRQCPESSQAIFHGTREGFIPFAPAGTVFDVWVVDVDGRPIYVQRAWTPKTPRSAREELNGVIDSIKLGTTP